VFFVNLFFETMVGKMPFVESKIAATRLEKPFTDNRSVYQALDLPKAK
jgi:hypothetical protein